MKMLTTKIKLGLAIASLSFGTCAQTADLTMTLGHVDPADWTSSKKGAAALAFKNLVEGETAGRIKVNLYPSGQLGGETELMQSAQDGTVSMTMVSGAYSKLCPEAAVLEIPYLFPSAPVAWDVLDGQFGRELGQHCLKKTGLRTLAFGETGFRNFTNSKRPINTPADLKGLKIRVMTAPLYVEMVKAMGAEPTPISWPEVPSALATGVVDGQENPVSVIYGNKLHEMQKYLTLDGHVYGTDFLLINDELFQSLSNQDQAVVSRAARVAGTVGRAIQQFNSADGLSKLSSEGMSVTAPTAAQMKAFREAAQPPVVNWLKTQIDASWISKVQSAVDKAASVR